MAHINILDTKLEELGHHLELDKSGEYYSCLHCGQRWNKKHRRRVIEYGVCPGPKIWCENQGMLFDIPRNVAPGCEIIWAGQKLHKSHDIVWKQGLVICMRCGALSQGIRVKHLSEKCKGCSGKASFPGICLKRFRCGAHPYGPKEKWLLPPATRSPDCFTDLDPAW